MIKTESLLMEIRHAKTFLDAAEAAAVSDGALASKVDVVRIAIEECRDHCNKFLEELQKR